MWRASSSINKFKLDVTTWHKNQGPDPESDTHLETYKAETGWTDAEASSDHVVWTSKALIGHKRTQISITRERLKKAIDHIPRAAS